MHLVARCLAVLCAIWPLATSAESLPATGPADLVAAPSSAPPEAAPGSAPKVRLGGYAKVGLLWQQADPQFDFIGRSNGFRISAARLEVTAHPAENAEAFFSLEAALDRTTSLVDVAGDKVVALRDGWLGYRFLPQLKLRAGQFKAPFLAETLVSDEALVFFERSIVVNGARPPEGFAADGLGLDRQIGAMLHGERIGLGPVGLTWALAVFDGNGSNRMFNDNRDVMPVGRLSLDFRELVAIGGAVYRNPRTVGDRPDLFEERDTGWTVDLAARALGADLLVAYVSRDRERLTADPAPPMDRATGLMAQASWRYEPWGLEPAFRLALLDPSSLSPFEKASWVSAGLNWKPTAGAVRAFAAYTVRTEEAARQLANDGVDIGAQVTF